MNNPLRKSILTGAIALVLSPALFAQGFLTTQKAYLTPAIGSDYTFTPIITAGESVQMTGQPVGTNYQLVGIPDGMGAVKNAAGNVELYCNHEFNNTQISAPQIGGPTYRGAFVSKFILHPTSAGVLSAGPAYTKVFQDDTLVGDIQTTLNPAVRAFGRFCSGSLAGKESGFDRPIFFANEETGGPNGAFDPRGGQAVAVFDNNGVGEAHALSYLGFFPWENTLVMPRRDAFTVIMGMEDGPNTPDSQLYMYVGRKVRSATATVLQRNGLVNGKLYAFRSTTPGATNEGNFTAQGTSITGEWVEIPNANTLTDAQLEAAVDGFAGGPAFGFVRTEDGCFDKNTPTKDFYFVSTGSGALNALGRLYQLTWSNPANPLSAVTLKMIYNGDTIDGGAANTGDIAFSPDNMDVSTTRMMIQEDGTTQSRAEMTARGRDGAIWSFAIPPTIASAKFQAELDPPAPAPNNQAVTAGVWESSGIIDATTFYGADHWLTNVQAHGPTGTAGLPGTTENGQILLMRPVTAVNP
jgi:secreted PhoX family phosphatase